VATALRYQKNEGAAHEGTDDRVRARGRDDARPEAPGISALHLSIQGSAMLYRDKEEGVSTGGGRGEGRGGEEEADAECWQGIVKLLGVCVEQGSFYLVQEIVNGCVRGFMGIVYRG
jgi:hypothetical protein